MKKQDKLDCQKIKEMIINNTLSISALSESHLNMLIEYETECLMECEAEYDMAFMDLCCNALERIHPLPVPTDERINGIGSQVFSQYKQTNIYYNKKNKTHFSILQPKQTVRILVATVLLVIALTATVIACWNPFINWITELRDILNMNRDEVIENEFGSFSSDQDMKQFSSIAEMETELGVHFDLFDKISTKPNRIEISQHGSMKTADLQYKNESTPISLIIYLENAPYYEEALKNANLQTEMLGNLEWYIVDRKEYQMIVSFDGIYVYSITADSLDTIKTLMEGN